jgi:hypothetical protein
MLDERMSKGGDRKSEEIKSSHEPLIEETAVTTAKKAETSTTKVKKVCAILDHTPTAALILAFQM